MGILLVEDDDDLRETIAVVLSFHGYAVDAVANLADARRQLRETKPHVVVVDALLGGESARALLEDIVGLDEQARPPTLIVSGSPAAERLAHDFALPLLCKPFDVDQLIDHVERLRRMRASI